MFFKGLAQAELVESVIEKLWGLANRTWDYGGLEKQSANLPGQSFGSPFTVQDRR